MAIHTITKFKRNLPHFVSAAKESGGEELFFSYLLERSREAASSNEELMVSMAHLIEEMLSYEWQFVEELSHDEKVYIETFSLLYTFLREEKLPPGVSNDLFEDLYQLLMRMEGKKRDKRYTRYKFNQHLSRWESGLNRDVLRRRGERKKRVIELLVEKIERRKRGSTRYSFTEEMSQLEKIRQVEEWWGDFRFHLSMAIKSPNELNLFLDESLSTRKMKILRSAHKKKIPFFITPYYLSLLNSDKGGFDDLAIRSYILYTQSLIDTYGNIKAWEREDSVTEGEPNAAGWLLPNSGNIHRRYPEVAIMIPDTRGRSCGGLCASCQRMFDFQNERLTFDLDSLKPKESWNRRLPKLMEYFEKDSQLRDILVTGGDALMSRDRALKRILEAILKMAKSKMEANQGRPDGEKYHQIERVRLGTRLLAYLPMRVDKELIALLKWFREEGSKVGIRQFVIQTHFQSPLEITPEAKEAIDAILKSGWIISNQLVFTAASSRRGHTAKLRESLNSVGVVTYYTFTVKGFKENREVFAPNARSLQEQQEEKAIGEMSEKQLQQLSTIFDKGDNIRRELNQFIRREKLPFLPTDRNVLNLPAVGKSMTFKMVGLSRKGRRILKFDHDRSREHSPIVDKLGEVYIIENRSIASYLRELEQMGEKRREYDSIWSYTSGITEPTFPLFQYPKSSYQTTDKITNYQEVDEKSN